MKSTFYSIGIKAFMLIVAGCLLQFFRKK